MAERRRFKHTENPEQRLAQQAIKLCKEAESTPPGIERDRLLRLARQAETGSRMSEWLRSPGLQPPKASLEKLRADAAEAAIIHDLATDKTKRDMYARLQEHLSRLADEVERAMNAPKTA